MSEERDKEQKEGGTKVLPTVTEGLAAVNVPAPVSANGTSKYKFTPLDKKMLRKEMLPDDVEELSGLLETEGIDISSPSFQRQIETRRQAAARQAEDHRKRTRTRVDGYDTTRNRILSARDYVALGFSFIFGVLSMLLTTLLLYASETFSVMYGIRSFLIQEDPLTVAIVIILAITLVSSYFAIEWRLAALIAKNGKPPVYRFSFAMWTKRLNYILGRDPNMQYEVIENAADIRAINSTRRVIIAIIVVLGVLGRLQSLLSQKTDLAWYDQIVSIFTTSNLQTFLEYIGGGAIALALLVATHYLISYIYEVYRNAVGGADEAGFFDPALQDKLEQQMLIALYRYKLQQIWVEREEQVRQYIEDVRQRQLALIAPTSTSTSASAKNQIIEGTATLIPQLQPSVEALPSNSNESSESLSPLSDQGQNPSRIVTPPIPPPNPSVHHQ